MNERILYKSILTYVAITALMLLFTIILPAQVLPSGTPPLRNFSKKVFQAAPQNWDISQSIHQNMYFANNLGLLRFDGTYWQVYPNANNTILRSLHHTSDERLYAGGQGEFGYYNYHNNGTVQYNSLNPFLPKGFLYFEDVWHTVEHNDQIYFQTNKEIFVYNPKSDSIIVFEFANKLDLIAATQSGLYAYVDDEGLYQLKNGSFSRISQDRKLASTVTALLEWNQDTLLIATHQNGLFWCIDSNFTPLIGKQNSYLKTNKINKLISLSDGNLAAATAQGGVLVFDPKGGKSQSIQKENGLQSNSILSVYQDDTQDLWVSSEHGIDLIQYHSAYRYLYPDGYLKGVGYAASYHQGRLYLGTSNGLYRHSVQTAENQFELIKGSEGQVWRLDTVFGQLLLGHHNGSYLVNGNSMTALYNQTGCWQFLPYKDSFILGGSYMGLILADWKSSNKFFNPLSGFKESSRILCKDRNNNIWMSHPYRGIYKLNIHETKLDLEAELYDKTKGIPTELNNYVFLINQTAYVSSEAGLLRYNFETDQFEKDSILESLINSPLRIQMLYQDSDNDIWFYTSEGLGLIKQKENGITRFFEREFVDPIPENLLGGFEFMYQISKDHFILGCEEGFLLFDKNSNKSKRQYRTKLSSIIIQDEANENIFSTLNGFQSGKLNTPLKLEYHQNKINFHFTTSSFGDEKREFRYRLEGLEDQFSEWSTQTEVSFSNLKPGSYIFHVQSRIGGQIQPDIEQFGFVITTPWYKTKMAIFLFALAFILIIGLLFFSQRMGFESEKRELTSQYREEVKEKEELAEQREQAIEQLKNEKLRSEIQHKDNELASATMHLVQKQELLSGIQKELSQVLKKTKLDISTKQELQHIISTLQQDIMFDEDWDRFTAYFDEVHSSFLGKLRQEYPSLTVNDHKLCAYLRMNLSTKDIAHLLNISVRGVEGSRYRLRKKLGLDSNDNLTEFIRHL